MKTILRGSYDEWLKRMVTYVIFIGWALAYFAWLIGIATSDQAMTNISGYICLGLSIIITLGALACLICTKH